ncbi:ROK family protein [Rhizobium sp. B21/90]|nr:ROK family protein [Rhizobium sp. B21/90]
MDGRPIAENIASNQATLSDGGVTSRGLRQRIVLAGRVPRSSHKKTDLLSGHHCLACLQTFVGGYQLVRHAEEFDGYPVTIDEFVEHARDGRLGYRRLIADAADKAGWGMGIAAAILNPPLFVIVGQLVAIGEAFLTPMERSSCATPSSRRTTWLKQRDPVSWMGSFWVMMTQSLVQWLSCCINTDASPAFHSGVRLPKSNVTVVALDGMRAVDPVLIAALNN